MYIVKVLKRKDGATLVVGVVVALILASLVASITSSLSSQIAFMGQNVPTTEGWRAVYLLPFVSAGLQLIVFELLIRAYVAIHESIS